MLFRSGRLFQLSPYKAVEKLKDDFGMALADGKVRLFYAVPRFEDYIPGRKEV